MNPEEAYESGIEKGREEERTRVVEILEGMKKDEICGPVNGLPMSMILRNTENYGKLQGRNQAISEALLAITVQDNGTSN